jgi:hypothetical protein
VIARVLLEKCRIQVLTKECSGLFLNEHPFIQFGQASLASRTKASQFDFADYGKR